MLDEESVTQAIFEYGLKKYGDRAEELFKEYSDEFPEYDWELPDEAWQKNYLCWLFLEKVMPKTGKTIAEEFAEISEELDLNLKMKICQMRNMIRSGFVVISKKDPFIKIKDMNDGKTYQIMLPKTTPPLQPNMMISGRIHPFGDHYRFTGIFVIKTTPLILDPDIFMDAFQSDQVNRIESMLIRNSSTFRSLMNKYPSHWINWICDHYNINEKLKKEKINAIENRIITDLNTIVKGLSSDARQVIQMCINQGGFVKYNVLKNFEDELDYFWDNHISISPIGELRQKGLLFIGKMSINDRKYKIAFIPEEFRDSLQAELQCKNIPIESYSY